MTMPQASTVYRVNGDEPYVTRTQTSSAVTMIHSFVRKAMVKTMFGVVRQKHEAGLSGCPAAFWKVEEDGEEEGESGDGAVVPRLGSRDAIENAADACVLWCTVAVGCLVGGRPKSSVSSLKQAIASNYCSSGRWLNSREYVSLGRAACYIFLEKAAACT